jgi:hypothetical protein
MSSLRAERGNPYGLTTPYYVAVVSYGLPQSLCSFAIDGLIFVI